MRQHARLSLSTRPSLRISPGVQLALELLQSPAQELRARIEREVASNPLLELLDDDEPDLPAGNGDAAEGRGSEEAFDFPTEANTLELPSSDDPFGSPSSDDPFDSPSSDDPFNSSSSDGVDGRDDLDPWNVAAAPRGVIETVEAVDRDRRGELGLQEVLIAQLRLEQRDPIILEQATFLIGCLDARGYLGASLEQIAEDLKTEPSHLEQALRAVQQLDPPGIGARDLRECLLLQLRRADSGQSLAAGILEEGFDLLTRHQYAALQRRFEIGEDELESALCEIRRLDPCPGGGIGAHAPQYVIPDLVVREVGDTLEVHLGERSSPRVRIDPLYSRLASEAPEPALGDFLNGRLRSARWFLRALDRRRLTLIRVTEAIVEAQSEFFSAGAGALRPLTLRQIADRVGLHESTVARVTKDKYVETPRGIFPLKFFFSSRISTESGRDTSARAVKSKIREMIDSEPSDQPLSDDAIVRCLEGEGIRIARRTVAKYRDQMRIARARFRRRRSPASGRRIG